MDSPLSEQNSNQRLDVGGLQFGEQCIHARGEGGLNISNVFSDFLLQRGAGGGIDQGLAVVTPGCCDVRDCGVDLAHIAGCGRVVQGAGL